MEDVSRERCRHYLVDRIIYVDRRGLTAELPSPVSTEAIGAKHDGDLVVVQQWLVDGSVMPYLVLDGTKVPYVVLAWRLLTDHNLPIWEMERKVSTAV